MNWRWLLPGVLVVGLGVTMIDWPRLFRPRAAGPATAETPAPLAAPVAELWSGVQAAEESRGEVSAAPAPASWPSQAPVLTTPPPQLGQAIRQVERVKRQVEEQFSAVAREREALRNELAARRQQVLVLERRIAQLSQQVSQQAQSLKELSAARAEAERALAEARQRLDAFERDPLNKRVIRLGHAEQAVKDLQAALKEQEQTSRQLHKQLTQSTKTVQTLTERVQSREAELARLEGDLSRLKAEQKKLARENKQLSRQAQRAGRKPWEGFERLFGQSDRAVHAGKGLFAMDQASVQHVLGRARDQVEQLADAVEDRDQVIAELQTALAEQERRLEQAEAVIALLEGRP